MKIEFLEKNNKKYNSYMFGSSRIGSTNPQDIENTYQIPSSTTLQLEVVTLMII